MKKINLYTPILALMTLFLVPRTHAGSGRFPKIESQKNSVIGSSCKSSTPAWDIVHRGVTLVFQCSDKHCPSKQSCPYVWQDLGLGKFNVAQLLYKGMTCKACKKKPVDVDKIKKIAFHNCKYAIQGVFFEIDKNCEEKGSERINLKNRGKIGIKNEVSAIAIHNYKAKEIVWYNHLTIETSEFPGEFLLDPSLDPTLGASVDYSLEGKTVQVDQSRELKI